jgi:transposase
VHAVCDGRGVPLALLLGPGNRHDRVYALPTVDALPKLRRRRKGRENRPNRLFADRGYDADWLRQALRERGIKPNIPEKQNPGAGRVRDQEAHERWPIERTNAWLHNYRRLTTRWERRPELYLAFAQLAASLIICRRLADAF